MLFYTQCPECGLDLPFADNPIFIAGLLVLILLFLFSKTEPK